MKGGRFAGDSLFSFSAISVQDTKSENEAKYADGERGSRTAPGVAMGKLQDVNTSDVADAVRLGCRTMGKVFNALLSARDVLGIEVEEAVIEKHRRAAFFSYSGPIPCPWPARRSVNNSRFAITTTSARASTPSMPAHTS